MNQTKIANKVLGGRLACQAWPVDGGDQGAGARGRPWSPVTHSQRAPSPAVVTTWGLVSNQSACQFLQQQEKATLKASSIQSLPASCWATWGTLCSHPQAIGGRSRPQKQPCLMKTPASRVSTQSGLSGAFRDGEDLRGGVVAGAGMGRGWDGEVETVGTTGGVAGKRGTWGQGQVRAGGQGTKGAEVGGQEKPYRSRETSAPVRWATP